LDVATSLSTLGIEPKIEGDLLAKKGLFTTEYALRLANGGETAASGEATSDVNFDTLMSSQVSYSGVARMPGELVKSNGKLQPTDQSIVWTTDPKEEVPEDYEALSQTTNWAMIIAVAVAALVALVVAIVLIVRALRKRPSKAR
jgi:hypothetical protein